MNRRKTVYEIDKKYHDRKVVLVDINDKEIGTASLIDAHRNKGLKHRAFSLQLYRKSIYDEPTGITSCFELLLQQRAEEKPVFPACWANTCCYNLAPGEIYLARAASRVGEELGAKVDASVLKELYSFSYEAEDLEGWCENELDTVIIGEWDGELILNPDEVVDAKWVKWGELNRDIAENPEKFAPWFRLIMKDSRFRAIFE